MGISLNIDLVIMNLKHYWIIKPDIKIGQINEGL